MHRERLRYGENGRWERVGGEKDGTLSYSIVVEAINSL